MKLKIGPILIYVSREKWNSLYHTIGFKFVIGVETSHARRWKKNLKVKAVAIK